jgi:hypothetical protein
MGKVCVLGETSSYCSVFLYVPSSISEGVRKSLARLLLRTRKTLQFGGYYVRTKSIGQERTINNSRLTSFVVDMAPCVHATNFSIRLSTGEENKISKRKVSFIGL